MPGPHVMPAEEKARLVLAILAGEMSIAEAARRAVGGHEILPGGGHVGARWWPPVLPSGGQGFCPR